MTGGKGEGRSPVLTRRRGCACVRARASACSARLCAEQGRRPSAAAVPCTRPSRSGRRQERKGREFMATGSPRRRVQPARCSVAPPSGPPRGAVRRRSLGTVVAARYICWGTPGVSSCRLRLRAGPDFLVAPVSSDLLPDPAAVDGADCQPSVADNAGTAGGLVPRQPVGRRQRGRCADGPRCGSHRKVARTVSPRCSRHGAQAYIRTGGPEERAPN